MNLIVNLNKFIQLGVMSFITGGQLGFYVYVYEYILFIHLCI